jgi:hypothetical protein
VPPTPQNHDFILIAIMEMKKDLGTISSQILHISENQRKSDSRLEKIEESLNSITKKQYAAWIVISIIVVLGGFFINKIWDAASDHIEISIKSIADKK